MPDSGSLLSQGPDNKLIVIDGNQRLLSVKLFINDAFELQGLTAYPELNGYTWSALDPRFRDHINNRTIRCITILKDTHPQIKFDVFERLNTGSVKLNAQELRHGLNHGAFMKMVDSLTKYEKWRKAVGIRSDKRMKGAELILRYFALRDNRASYEKPLSSFLDQYSTNTRNMSATEVHQKESQFKILMDKVDKGLGNLAFRIYDDGRKPITPFNSALYDAEMVGFTETKNEKIQSNNYESVDLQNHLVTLFKIERFLNSIRQATSDEHSVRARIDMMIEHLDQF
jgi:hypothetical protein